MGGTRHPAALIALLARSGQGWDSPASSEGSERNRSTAGTRFLEEGEGRPDVQVGGSSGHPTLSARAAGVRRGQDGLFWALLPPHPLRSSLGTRRDAALNGEERPRPESRECATSTQSLPLSRRGLCRKRMRSGGFPLLTRPPPASAASVGFRRLRTATGSELGASGFLPEVPDYAWGAGSSGRFGPWSDGTRLPTRRPGARSRRRLPSPFADYTPLSPPAAASSCGFAEALRLVLDKPAWQLTRPAPTPLASPNT